MNRAIAIGWALALTVLVSGPHATLAAAESRYRGPFDVDLRREELRRPDMAVIRDHCLAVPASPDWASMPPVRALAATSAYGSDRAAEDFSWAVMVLAGRALAGDGEAADHLRALLSSWAEADALSGTETHYDPFYALKRVLQPLTVAYAILEPSLDAAERDLIANWIDRLVRRIDATFDKEVDVNNHRILADAVLASWGSVTGDKAMVDKAVARFEAVLSQMRPDGALPLEARRGARALWYQRQALSSLTVIAEVAKGQGVDPYRLCEREGRSFAALLGWLLEGLASPLRVAVYSAQNHIPGPERDFRKLDVSFLATRPHGRHYMAWTEAAVAGGEGLSFRRLQALHARDLTAERPLIDEFAGGNATCFWGRP